jgi:hypothetical protein
MTSFTWIFIAVVLFSIIVGVINGLGEAKKREDIAEIRKQLAERDSPGKKPVTRDPLWDVLDKSKGEDSDFDPDSYLDRYRK